MYDIDTEICSGPDKAAAPSPPSGLPGLPLAARLPINRCNLPAAILGGGIMANQAGRDDGDRTISVTIPEGVFPAYRAAGRSSTRWASTASARRWTSSGTT